MITRLISLFLLVSLSLRAQEETRVLHIKEGDLEGSLLVPISPHKVPLVLIVAGSGPTDRNGNNEEMQNNSLKLLADSLKAHGIASFRFDKRGVGQSGGIHLEEMELRPETYVQDIKDWIALLSNDKRFSKLTVAGHSEGALLGMLASVGNPKVSGFISIAGAGRPIDEVLKEQFSSTPDNIKEIIYGMLDKLKKGDTLSNIPPIFYGLFRPTVQPYMIAWMKYDPQAEIKKLKVPILITTGTTDIQVKERDAQALAKAQPKAQLHIIKNMNHVLKTCDTLDKTIQMGTYNDPSLPLHPEFSRTVVDFINSGQMAGKPPLTTVHKD